VSKSQAGLAEGSVENLAPCIIAAMVLKGMDTKSTRVKYIMEIAQLLSKLKIED
jgi:hypothetical protein